MLSPHPAPPNDFAEFLRELSSYHRTSSSHLNVVFVYNFLRRQLCHGDFMATEYAWFVKSKLRKGKGCFMNSTRETARLADTSSD
jgi:hypothetical protein